METQSETHCFNVLIAQRHGIKAAVLFQNLWFWVKKNSSEGRNIFKGCAWTYNTQEALSRQLPYLSQSQIQRELKRLEDAGLIVKGNFNTSQYNRTCWYTIGAEGYRLMLHPDEPELSTEPVENSVENSPAILQNCNIEVAKLQNASCENEESILQNCNIHSSKSQNVLTDINTYINTNINTNINTTLGARRVSPAQVHTSARDPPYCKMENEIDDYNYKSWLGFINKLNIEQPKLNVGGQTNARC